MKKKLLLAVLFIFCLATILGTFLAANAADSVATSIKGHTLSLDDNIRILYYVEENAPKGAECGLLCWTEQQENYTLENKQYQFSSTEKGIVGGTECSIYTFPHLAAKMMTVDVYAVSYVKVGDEVTYSKPDKYSVLRYCMNKKESAFANENGTIPLSELIPDILEYGTAAQKFFGYRLDRLANATYYEIRVENGYLPDKIGYGLYQEGEVVTLQTSLVPPEGYRVFWTNDSGRIIGVGESFQITVGQENEKFFASCTDKEICVEHVEVIDPAIAPTCTETGLTEGVHCSVCGSVLLKQQVIPANGHHYGDWIPEILQTCTKNGVKGHFHCADCEMNFDEDHKQIFDLIHPATGHTEVIDAAVSETCTQTGLTEGKHCSICGEVLVEQMVIPARGHTEVIDSSVAATCTKAGKTQGKHCSVCGIVLVAQSTIPAKGHTIVTDAAVSATCTRTGKTQGSHCSVCRTVLTAQTTIPALGHNYIDRVCTRCGNVDYSVGLSFTSNGDGTCYVSGTGSCKDSVIAIPQTSPAGDRVTSIAYKAFNNTKFFSSVIIPDSVTSIDTWAFEYCNGLKKVTIGNGLTIIADGTFYNCNYLESVVIGEKVETICKDAFSRCYNLISVTFKDNNRLKSIGRHAFYGCSSLTGVYITDIEAWCGVSFDIGDYEETSNPIMRAKNLYMNGNLVKNLVIPKTVTSISRDAFYGCSCITSITFEAGSQLTQIGYRAFSRCTGLTGSLVIPDNVNSIGDWAFEYCGITSITFPKSAAISVGSGVCYKCNNLKNVYFSSNLQSIGSEAFYGNTSLANIYFNGTKTQWNAISKGSDWKYNTGSYTIHCTDGDIAK
ncbi:MAG: leucine-rich repeat domain-containing protein [Ruminococcaceae bacterium]|nr:leucine-rich repeat domain-containing protein [Oscillospiraceae bacterium]